MSCELGNYTNQPHSWRVLGLLYRLIRGAGDKFRRHHRAFIYVLVFIRQDSLHW